MFGKLFRKKKKKRRSSGSAPRAPQKAAPRHASARVSPSAQRNPTQRNQMYNRNAPRKRRAKGEPGFVRRTLSSRGFWNIVVRLGIAGVIVLGLIVMIFAQTLPDIRELNTIRKQQGVTITTEDGRVVANYGDVYGEYVPYEALPKHLVEAVIATEDRRFFAHGGIDVWGILRAAVKNASAGRVVQGGSTVTQQVAKNVFLTPERSLTRKIQEVLLAFWLEGRFNKQEIMAIYLNRVYLGSGAYGVDAAAKRYFNKRATELNLAESALIAGLLKAPSRYSPAASPERAEKRIHQVLLNMVDAGFLRAEAVEPALKAFHDAPEREAEGGNVRYYTDWIMDEIPNFIGNVEEDLIVATTFDPKLQGYAVDALENVLSAEGEKRKVSQGAVVAMTPDGAVKAVVGGMEYGKSQYNRATQAKRQPGSIFKLFVYLAALESGFTPESIVVDAPVVMRVGNKTWTPTNYGGGYKGELPMVQALRESLNTVAVRLSQYTGVQRVAEMAERLGLPDIPAHPSIALGAVEATLLDMTGAFAHLANDGNKVEPYGILAIAKRDGEVIYQRKAPAEQRVLAEGTVQMMNYMLIDAVRRGTGARAALGGRAAAGKTGTSQDFKDAWFVGFTPQLVAGVWVGNDDNAKMAKVTGGTLPAPIWRDFMTHAMEGQEVRGIPNSPSNSSGLLPWLFGGQQNMTLEGVPQAGEPIPEGSPFGVMNAPQGNIAPAPTFAPAAPQPAAQPAAAPRPSESSNGDVLTPEFWNKLMKDNTPSFDKGKVEYTYPGARR